MANGAEMNNTRRELIVMLALLAGFGWGAVAVAGSVFWQPYELDGATVALFAADGAAVPAAVDLDDLLEPQAVPGAGDGEGLGLPLAALPADALRNAHPGGRPGSLRGGAMQVGEGRFGGGVRLPTAVASFVATAGSARGTTEFWLKVEAMPSEPAVLLRRHGREQPDDVRLLLLPDGAVELLFGRHRFAGGDWRLTPGRWTHLAVVMDWQFEFNGLVRLHADGEMLVEATPRWDYRVGNALAALDELRLGGVVGWLDEIRVSRGGRTYYPYQLGWEDVAGRRPPPGGPPFFRAAGDLRLHLGFDGTVEAGVAPPGLVVRENALRVRGLGDRPEQRGFAAGVHRHALQLGPGSAQPEYVAPALVDANRGSLAFWLRPLNWDNFTRVDHRRAGQRVRRLTLFRLFGDKPPAIRRFNPMRGGDPSLLALTVEITPNLESALPPPLHPGRWTHVAVTWQDGQLRTYVDGRQVGNPGLAAAIHGWWREGSEQLRGDIFTGSTPTRLAIEGQAGEARTLIDELRFYSRPLAQAEIANLVAWPDSRREATPLPAIEAELAFNGAIGEVAVRAMPLLPDHAQARQLAVWLTREGGGQVGERLAVDLDPWGATSARLKSSPLDFGDYRVAVEASAADGRALARVELPASHARPPWWQTEAGRVKAALPGWTPVGVDGATVRVVGRELRFAPSALPAGIEAAGDELLAGPVELRLGAGGVPLAMQPTGAVAVDQVDGTQAVVRGGLHGDHLRVTVAATVAFDGLAWFELTFEAVGDGAPAGLDFCELRIPLRAVNATLCHWSAATRGFREPRSNWIGELPAGEGVLLRSNDFERWQRAESLRGSFLPYVLLTGMDRGLAWFAENDRGWTQHEEVPAVAVERSGEVVTLVLRMIAEPVTLDQLRTIAFGLQPIPVKPLDPDWRRSPAWDGTVPDTFAGNNLKGGQETVFWLYPENGDWEAVRRRLAGEGATQRIVGRAEQRNRAFVERHGRPPRAREMHVPSLYWDMQWVGGWPEHTRPWAAGWHPDYTYYLPEFVDFSVWAWREWVRNSDGVVAGIYLDDCWPIPSKLASSPVAHTLPDGHVQPGWQWRAWRERMMRTRQVFHDQGLPPKICAHTTHTQFIPYHSFFDYLLDGEDHYSSPPRQSDFIDHWSLARLRFAHAGKWGIVTGWLGWTGNSTPTDKYPAWTYRQQRAYAAMLALHDIGWPFADGIEAQFALREADTAFVPYWGADMLADHRHEQLKLAAWRRPGQCLVLLVNLGDERLAAELSLAPAAMGFAGRPAADLGCRDVDRSLLVYFADDPTNVELPTAEVELEFAGGGSAREPFPGLDERPEDLPSAERRADDPDGAFVWRDGTLRCPVRRHDYRLFLFEAKPGP